MLLEYLFSINRNWSILKKYIYRHKENWEASPYWKQTVSDHKTALFSKWKYLAIHTSSQYYVFSYILFMYGGQEYINQLFIRVNLEMGVYMNQRKYRFSLFLSTSLFLLLNFYFNLTNAHSSTNLNIAYSYLSWYGGILIAASGESKVSV